MQLSVLIASVLAAGAAVDAASYTPQNVSCPDNANFIRNAADGLSPAEKEWLKKRDPITRDALQTFLRRAFANVSTEITSALFNDTENVPKLGIAVAGGGYRAMFVGAGAFAAMDNRTDGANEHGLGGLLQAATYMAGLSGGNWLTGTLAYNNFTSVQQILEEGDKADAIWNITNSFLNPYDKDFSKTLARWTAIGSQVQGKRDAGFNVTITDLWSRALAYGWFPTLPNAGAGLTWSSLRDNEIFMNGEMPMPISVADGRYPGTTVINLNATVFEMTPFEIGSWDPSLNAFSDIKYLGTQVTDGKPETERCINGFDDASFIMGTSSSLFNEFTMSNDSAVAYTYLNTLSSTLVKGIDKENNDIAMYAPNPFKGSKYVDSNYTTSIVDSDSLFLVDGGEDLQGIPFVPLLKQERDLDIIFAIDVDTETSDNYPAGGPMMKTYERQFSKQGKGMAFPYVPDMTTFVNLGLGGKPSFYGCDANNLTDLEYIPPLIVYIPNSYHSFESNVSTFKLNYNYSERVGMIRNAFEATTRNNLTEDADYVTCVGCAIIRRKQQSLNLTLPDICDKCFTNYCWNGTIDNTPTKLLTPNNQDPAAISSAIAAVTDDSPIGALLNTGSGTKSNSSSKTNSTLVTSSRATSTGTLISNSSSNSTVSSTAARSSTSSTAKKNAGSVLKLEFSKSASVMVAIAAAAVASLI
ncbi:PLB2 [Nakaseomyces glabratus]|uniref:Lysophospholipase 2 n=2 Tax=Candida glabrata TaxID=5478 RepID=PLB2_CANGA|nr:uncharacterized protein CAGL0J11748g [Nakaseomyces glabratus]Q8TG06.2 RecName: Full=Lysophospholipase 2; AltName: Full=Phospholipase B 2; Flags: Precursor [Nakaseomyces glabratus CBS 138]KAH7583829.1 Lysophospholipase catalytic domain [Nakaseomyces glabratus]KAH7584319.1 Lysophospholipase catalytic domain [Nakaseomyces glabratus]KAH7585562.1 Lysophospholipase catalytic domain [Nakaseomyces glabratus]KAH7598063.1 Lysophospholipase catalytic domain [Nakaseomyces glabratus]KAH7598641.1 Lysoph|eukprot:XP_448224.1 uncharacterized protein CAGL0J11748g [[Candida] glabrata]